MYIHHVIITNTTSTSLYYYLKSYLRLKKCLKSCYKGITNSQFLSESLAIVGEKYSKKKKQKIHPLPGQQMSINVPLIQLQ